MMKKTKTTRRELLRIGCASIAGLALPHGLARLIANEKSVAKADSVLFLNLLGGPSHLDTLWAYSN
jgi:hypothetical protein